MLNFLFRFKKFVAFKIIRVTSFLLFRTRAAVTNEFGSFISPKESLVGTSVELHALLTPVMKKLSSQKIELPLVRLGSKGDGGYVVLDKNYEDSYLISGGISNDNNFEIALANLGMHGHQVDFTIASPPISHPNLSFSRQKLVAEGANKSDIDVSLDQLFEHRSAETYDDLMLKLDIEGSEWGVLQSSRSLIKFSQVLIELHYLERLANPRFSKQYLEGLERLLEYFFPIFITGNNCCGYATLGGYSVPRVMEISLLNRKIYSTALTDINETNSIFQSQNYPSRAPLVLKNW